MREEVLFQSVTADNEGEATANLLYESIVAAFNPVDQTLEVRIDRGDDHMMLQFHCGLCLPELFSLLQCLFHLLEA